MPHAGNPVSGTESAALPLKGMRTAAHERNLIAAQRGTQGEKRQAPKPRSPSANLINSI
jgi:hypothetical protein